LREEGREGGTDGDLRKGAVGHAGVFKEAGPKEETGARTKFLQLVGIGIEEGEEAGGKGDGGGGGGGGREEERVPG